MCTVYVGTLLYMKLPHSVLKVWGVGDSLLTNYIKLEPDGSIELCRGKPLQDTYLHKLVSSMEELFVSLYGVTPSLVADFNQHVYRSAGCVSVSAEMVTMETKYATEDGRLFRCLLCAGLSHVPAVSVVTLCLSVFLCTVHIHSTCTLYINLLLSLYLHVQYMYNGGFLNLVVS